jgi:hypothetical protein
MRLGNMATLAREWAAVQRVQFSPFKDILLSGKPRISSPAAQLEVPQRLMEHLQHTFNKSQLDALTVGLDGSPFVLIQGPPGTGKTQCAPDVPPVKRHCFATDFLSAFVAGVPHKIPRMVFRTILGLLSILKSSVRKGCNAISALSMPRRDPIDLRGMTAAEERVARTLQEWHLNCPWLATPAGKTCARHSLGSLRCPKGAVACAPFFCASHVTPPANVILCRTPCPVTAN